MFSTPAVEPVSTQRANGSQPPAEHPARTASRAPDRNATTVTAAGSDDQLAPVLARAVADRAAPSAALGLASGPLLQRDDDDESLTAKITSAITGFRAAVGGATVDVAGAGSNVTGGIGTAAKGSDRVRQDLDAQATLAGGIIGVIASFVEICTIVAETHRAWGPAFDTGASPLEQETAHAALGDHLQRAWRWKDKVFRDGLALASWKDPTNIPLDIGARAALPIADFWNLYVSVLTLARNSMELVEIQELQFSGWADPERAGREALQESARATRMLHDARSTAVSALELHTSNQRELNDSPYDDSVEAAAKAYKRIKRRQKHGAGGAGLDDMETAWEGEMARRDRLRIEHERLEQRCADSASMVFIANEGISIAQEMVQRATEKERALKRVRAELEKAARLRSLGLDTRHRYVPLAEIKEFAGRQLGITLHADRAVLLGTGIAAGAGLSVLALGWTPLGWFLLAAAGGLVVGAQLVKLAKNRSERLAYAEHLWHYVEHGYDAGHMFAPPDDERVRGRSDALALLSALGIGWSADRLPAKTTGIDAIAKALMGGGEGV